VFKKIVVSSMGYPGVALAYWLRFLSPRVSIVTPSLSVLEDVTTPRRWGRSTPFYSRRYVEDVLGVKEGDSGDVYVEVTEPHVRLGGRTLPLYRASTFRALAEAKYVEISGPGAAQLSYYAGWAGEGGDVEARVFGETQYRITCGEREAIIRGGLFEENVEQAAAEAAMRILGLPPGPRLRLEIVERGEGVDFTLGSGDCEHSTRVASYGCGVRICVEDDAISRISGQACRVRAIEELLLVFLERNTSEWMPLLAAAWSPLFPERRRFAPLAGLWRKTIPKRLLQLGEGRGSCILV